jgi:hypothetical protein
VICRLLPLRAALAVLLLAAAGGARASFLHGETLDTAADWLAIFVIVIVPIIGIVAFWLVHILPEKIAEKRHHPQQQAINTLCLLSLVFGGMLWPIAWLWAFTRPVGFKLAYGTDKHEDYFVEMGGKAREGRLGAPEIAQLRDELDAVAARGTLPPPLRVVRSELDALHQRALAAATPAPAPASAPTAGGGR